MSVSELIEEFLVSPLILWVSKSFECALKIIKKQWWIWCLKLGLRRSLRRKCVCSSTKATTSFGLSFFDKRSMFSFIPKSLARLTFPILIRDYPIIGFHLNGASVLSSIVFSTLKAVPSGDILGKSLNESSTTSHHKKSKFACQLTSFLSPKTPGIIHNVRF